MLPSCVTLTVTTLQYGASCQLKLPRDWADADAANGPAPSRNARTTGRQQTFISGLLTGVDNEAALPGSYAGTGRDRTCAALRLSVLWQRFGRDAKDVVDGPYLSFEIRQTAPLLLARRLQPQPFALEALLVRPEPRG